jgi:hypothetical protein
VAAVKKLLGALTFMAIGACMIAPANAVVMLSPGGSDTVKLSLFGNPLQEIQFTVGTGMTEELTISSGKKTPLDDFGFASFEAGNVPKTFKLGLLGGNVSMEEIKFTAGTWDIFVGFNPFDSWRILGSVQPLTFALSNPVPAGTSAITPGVPETSTWIMMILGFSAMGFAGLPRARKSSLAAA